MDSLSRQVPDHCVTRAVIAISIPVDVSTLISGNGV